MNQLWLTLVTIQWLSFGVPACKRNICTKTHFFFQLSKVSYFVDDTISKIGTKYLGYPVLSPHILLNDNLPIVIAATQGYPYIYDKLLKLGINDMRVIRRIII